MPWLPIALATAVAFGLYNVCIKQSSAHIDEVLGAVVLQVVAAVLGGAFALWLQVGGHRFEVGRTGVWLAVAAGVCVGLAEIGTFVVYARGAPVSTATPIILGGSVLVAAAVGAVVLREAVGWSDLVGVGLVVAGIAVLTSGAR